MYFQMHIKASSVCPVYYAVPSEDIKYTVDRYATSRDRHHLYNIHSEQCCHLQSDLLL